MFFKILVYFYVLMELLACNGQSTVFTGDTATCNRRPIAYEDTLLRLLEQNAQLTERLNAQEEQSEYLTHSLSSKEEQIENQLQRLAAIEEELARQADLIISVEEIKENQNMDMDKLKYQVAFTATKTSAQVPGSDQEIITFTNVQLNKGNGYSANTSKFTCPVTGVYFFCFGLPANLWTEYPNTRSSGLLVKNGEVLVGNYKGEINGLRREFTHSACAAVSANRNDQVWVKAEGISDGTVWAYGDQYRGSWFTGILIQRMDY